MSAPRQMVELVHEAVGAEAARVSVVQGDVDLGRGKVGEWLALVEFLEGAEEESNAVAVNRAVNTFADLLAGQEKGFRVGGTNTRDRLNLLLDQFLEAYSVD